MRNLLSPPAPPPAPPPQLVYSPPPPGSATPWSGALRSHVYNLQRCVGLAVGRSTGGPLPNDVYRSQRDQTILAFWHAVVHIRYILKYHMLAAGMAHPKHPTHILATGATLNHAIDVFTTLPYPPATPNAVDVAAVTLNKLINELGKDFPTGAAWPVALGVPEFINEFNKILGVAPTGAMPANGQWSLTPMAPWYFAKPHPVALDELALLDLVWASHRGEATAAQEIGTQAQWRSGPQHQRLDQTSGAYVFSRTEVEMLRARAIEVNQAVLELARVATLV